MCVHRVLRPPGGGSSNIFGGFEDDAGASRRTNKMASTVFAPPEEPQGGTKRANPPGINIWFTKALFSLVFFWIAGVKFSPHCNQDGCVMFFPHTLCSDFLDKLQVWVPAFNPWRSQPSWSVQSLSIPVICAEIILSIKVKVCVRSCFMVHHWINFPTLLSWVLQSNHVTWLITSVIQSTLSFLALSGSLVSTEGSVFWFAVSLWYVLMLILACMHP